MLKKCKATDTSSDRAAAGGFSPSVKSVSKTTALTCKVSDGCGIPCELKQPFDRGRRRRGRVHRGRTCERWEIWRAPLKQTKNQTTRNNIIMALMSKNSLCVGALWKLEADRVSTLRMRFNNSVVVEYHGLLWSRPGPKVREIGLRLAEDKPTTQDGEHRISCRLMRTEVNTINPAAVGFPGRLLGPRDIFVQPF